MYCIIPTGWSPYRYLPGNSESEHTVETYSFATRTRAGDGDETTGTG